MKCTKVVLDSFEEELAMKIGDGDVCLGIRRALALTGLRLEGTPQKKGAVVDQEPDRLTIVTNQMAELADELKQCANPTRREEIAVQLIRLGKLYLAIRAGGEPSLDDR
jgi:hypothetical protein